MKVLYVISDIDKAVAFEWIATYLNKEKFDLSFVLLTEKPSHLEAFLREHNMNVTRIHCGGKKDWISAWWKLYNHTRKLKPALVHCHLITANILGLSAAKMAGVSKRIYTRHHASQHHVYHPKGVWWDKMSNAMATHVVAISSIVAKILREWENVPPEKIILIPHGFLWSDFRKISSERIRSFQNGNTIENQRPLIGVVSRFTKLKGVQYIIPAFQMLIRHHPNAVLLLLNATGDYELEIKDLLKNVPERNYRLIPFVQDIGPAFASMDVFIHTPISEDSEAFGQIFVEALAAGTPSVFTKSGIASDFIIDGYNALVVPYRDSHSIYTAMLQLLEDDNLKKRLIQNSWESIKERFELKNMIEEIEKLYGAG